MTMAKQENRRSRRNPGGERTGGQRHPRIVSFNPAPSPVSEHRWLAHDAVARAVLPGHIGNRLLALRPLLTAKSGHNLAALLVRVSVDRLGTQATFDLGGAVELSPTGPRCLLPDAVAGDVGDAMRALGRWRKAVGHDDVLGALFRAPYESTAVIVILRCGVYLSPAQFLDPTRGWHRLVPADVAAAPGSGTLEVAPPALSWVLGAVEAYRDGRIVARDRTALEDEAPRPAGGRLRAA